MDGFRDICTATPLQEELGMSLTMSPWKDYKDSDESIKESHISAGAAQMPCIIWRTAHALRKLKPGFSLVGGLWDFVTTLSRPSKLCSPHKNFQKTIGKTIACC